MSDNGVELPVGAIDVFDAWFRRTRTEINAKHVYVLKMLRCRTMTAKDILEEANYSRPKSARFVLQRVAELLERGLVSLTDGQYDITPSGEQVLAEQLA